MEILSPQNARVKGWAQLQEKKHRDKQNKYVVEGIHLVQEALSSRVDISVLRMMWRRAFPRNFVIYRIQDKVLNGLAYPMPSSRRSVTRRHRSRCLPWSAKKHVNGRT